MKNSDEILGGYNPIEWKRNVTYSNTNKSFIFSFRGIKRIESHILSRVANNENAIRNDRSTFGSLFGSFGQTDLFLGDRHSSILMKEQSEKLKTIFLYKNMKYFK